MLGMAASVSAADLAVGTAQANAGGTVNISITLNPQGAQVAGLQLDLNYDKSALSITAAAGSAAVAANKSITSVDMQSFKRILVVGINQTPIASGSVVDLTIAVSQTAAAGVYPLTLTGVSGTDPSATTIQLGANSGSVTVGTPPTPRLAINKSH